MARPIRRASILLAALLTAGALAACGSGGPTDREQIGAIVKDEGTHPVTLCHHLADSLLVRFGGLGNCLSRAASASRDPSTRATHVAVQGKTATAVVVDSTGSRSITLVKQKGSWLISGVR